ncbi:MAG: voltage-gated potassium channel [Campylobacterota bacterium]|nr:voltage-gated potassium channel [Campylobacterota bacterium]
MFKKIKNFLNWEGTPKPEISLEKELYEELKPFRVPIILVILISTIGTLGYIVIDNMSLMDAIYQTGITFTTVGFGEMAPISNAGRVFTITLIILGFSIFTFAVGILIEVINKGKLLNIIKERSMLYKIARLKNHYVICYHNEYTIEVTREFRRAQVPFVVIDSSKDFEKEAEIHKYPYYINAEPSLDTTLRKAHFSSAKGMIILSKNMPENVAQISIVRLFEKEIERQKPYQIITISETTTDILKLKKLGADNIIAPNKLMAQRVSAMAFRPDMENLLENFLYKRDTPLDMEEIKVPKQSWVIFKKLKETHLRDIAQVSVVGIKEKDGKFIPMPKGDTQIMVDSTLLIIGTSQGIATTKKLLAKKQKPEELKYT